MRNITDQTTIDSHFAKGDELEAEQFPQLAALSCGWIYQFMPVARVPEPPEVVFVPPPARMEHPYFVGVLATWNHLWESAQYRGQIFNEDRHNKRLPSEVTWIRKLPPANIYLVADTKTKYDAYAPLLHLLPKNLLDRHRLPAFKRPLWPVNTARPWTDSILSHDFSERLSHAFAEHIWSNFDRGSGIRAFSSTDPLVLLSHSLDFWLPHAISVMENRMRASGRLEPESHEQLRLLTQARRRHKGDQDVTIERPHWGGYLWMGEEEAAHATQEIIQTADQAGQLRGIMDAIKSNRVVDDFSSRWSFAREDFERKLYSKRSKVKISFVELKDTLAVHSPRSEYTDDLLWQDFSALLNKRERHVVVCLRNGTTKLTDIAQTLGYANHSPVSKALARIRKKAASFLNLN
jgi:hypothetical protein